MQKFCLNLNAAALGPHGYFCHTVDLYVCVLWGTYRCVVGLVMQGQHAALLSYPQVSVIEKVVIFLQHCRNIPYKWKNENAASIYAKFLQTLAM